MSVETSDGRGAEAEDLSCECDPAVDALASEVIAAVADRWTMLILGALEQRGTLRFTELGRHLGGVSQKMLTKTLRAMERDGLVARTVFPVIPPHVEYRLTDAGLSLSEAFCGVWSWAAAHRTGVEAARHAYDAAVRTEEERRRKWIGSAAPRTHARDRTA
jgi:DNA-binding HxlR family transcriptional regulator